jgi:hypothetical protein
LTVGHREAARRKRMGAGDFDLLMIIGKGAFGEGREGVTLSVWLYK